MNTIKRRRLKAKRTPWVKSKYSRYGRLIHAVNVKTILAQAHSVLSSIKSTPTFTVEDRANKLIAIADYQNNIIKAIARVGVVGSKGNWGIYANS